MPPTFHKSTHRLLQYCKFSQSVPILAKTMQLPLNFIATTPVETNQVVVFGYPTSKADFSNNLNIVKNIPLACWLNN